jgi:hypothetical protein
MLNRFQGRVSSSANHPKMVDTSEQQYNLTSQWLTEKLWVTDGYLSIFAIDGSKVVVFNRAGHSLFSSLFAIR